MTGYLTSTAWFRRRDQWFTEEQQRTGELRCTLCQKTATKRQLELHHLDYDGVTQLADGRWVAGEAHEDLTCLHPRCHEWVHKALDTDAAAGAAISRRVANERVIARLQHKILTYLSGLR